MSRAAKVLLTVGFITLFNGTANAADTLSINVNISQSPTVETIDIVEYLMPKEGRLNQFTGQFIMANQAQYFIEYISEDESNVFVKQYTVQRDVQQGLTSHLLTLLNDKIEFRTEKEMGMAGVIVNQVQPMDRHLAVGEYNEIYGILKGYTGPVSLWNNELVGDCIAFEDSNFEHIFCKNFGIVKINVLQDESRSMTLERRGDGTWENNCPAWISKNRDMEPADISPELCQCIEEKVPDQTEALAEYYNMMLPLGTGSFASEYYTAEGECMAAHAL